MIGSVPVELVTMHAAGERRRVAPVLGLQHAGAFGEGAFVGPVDLDAGGERTGRDPDDDLFDFPASRPLVLGTSAFGAACIAVAARHLPRDLAGRTP